MNSSNQSDVGKSSHSQPGLPQPLDTHKLELTEPTLLTIIGQLERVARRIMPSHAHDIVADVLAKFATNPNGELNDLPFLKRCVSNKSIDYFRRLRCETSQKVEPMASTRAEAAAVNFEEAAFVFAAVTDLPPAEGQVLQIEFGWDDRFPNGVEHGKRARAARQLGISLSRYYKLAEQGKAKLTKLATDFDTYGNAKTAAALRSVAGRGISLRGFSSPLFRALPLARYSLRIFRLAHDLGTATLDDLFRALATADFVGSPGDACAFAALIMASPALHSAPAQLRGEILTTTAVMYDHFAAYVEREGDYEAALDLIGNALSIVNELVGEHDADALEKFGDQYTRICLQQGIFLRRSSEIRASLGRGLDLRALDRARRLFAYVAAAARRPDHRCSALHQLGVLLLLAGDLAGAESTILEAIHGWDSLIEAEPDELKQLEMLVRLAYAHRRLFNVEWARSLVDSAAAARHRRAALLQLDMAEALARRSGNLRFLYELDAERRRLPSAPATP